MFPLQTFKVPTLRFVALLTLLFLLVGYAPRVLAGPVYIATSPVNLHLYQSVSSEVLLEIPKGAKVKVMDSSNGSWWQIQYKGRTGFSQRNYLRYSEVNDRLDHNPVVNISTPYKSKPSFTVPERASLYEHPSVSSAVVTRIPSGQTVKIVDKHSSVWWMIHYKGHTGYIQPTASSSSATEPVGRDRVAGARPRYSLSGATSLRTDPDSQAKVILRFENGDQVTVLDDSGEWWWKVNFNGTIGWVKRRLLEKE